MTGAAWSTTAEPRFRHPVGGGSVPRYGLQIGGRSPLLRGSEAETTFGERPVKSVRFVMVGGCRDLVATVVQPLKDLYGERFRVAPYAVLFKPSHGLKILRNEAGSGFSPRAAYIFRKQLEEADAVVINRVDELTPQAVEEL